MTKIVRKPRTRAQWAARIRAEHKETVHAILKLGDTLLAAKKSLPHGEFLKMIKTDLPFTATVAERLMMIAADPKITNAAHAQLLPARWTTLYELTKMPTEPFERAVASGAVRPEMTRKDASLLKLSTTHERRTPAYVTQEGTPLSLPPSLRPETLASAPLPLLEKLERLEKVVTELSTGGIPTGSEAERRIRVAANKLLSLIGQGGESLH
jgi:hypothetical protein